MGFSFFHAKRRLPAGKRRLLRAIVPDKVRRMQGEERRSFLKKEPKTFAPRR
jgi:hypothetical protein